MNRDKHQQHQHQHQHQPPPQTLANFGVFGCGVFDGVCTVSDVGDLGVGFSIFNPYLNPLSSLLSSISKVPVVICSNL